MFLAILATAVALTAAPASAYAAGNSAWGVVCFKGICVPSGTMLHVVDGRGIALRYDRVQITSAAPVCNWWVDFDYFDHAGNNYRHIQGQMRPNCIRDAHVRIDYPTGPYLWKTGRACATLFSNAIRLTRHCHSLHP